MLDKIKNISKMQGILYEKMKKKKTGKEEAAHPKTRAGRILYHLRKELGYEQSKFLIHPTRAFVTIPTPGETKIKSVMYPVIKPYAYANIRYNESENVFEYFVIEPRLNEHEEKILEKLKEGLIQIIDVSLADIKNPQKMIAFLEKGVQQLLTEYNFLLNEKEYVKIMYYIYRDFVGLNRIEAMMNDPYIEDIGCLPFDEKLFVREEGRIKLIQIGELIESQLADGIGIGSPKTKIEVLSFNPATMRAEYRNAIGLLRKNNRHGYYIDVKTEGGNHISVSPDHPMLVLSKDGIIVKRADSIKEGDYVLRLKNLSTDAQKVHIDLIDELSRINKNFRVKGANSLITSNLDVSKVLGISNRLVALWKRNNSMPIWAYLKLEKDSSLRKSLKVSPGQGVKNWIPAIIEPDEDFALFLGLFLAEGYYENAGISFAFGKHEKGLHDLTAGLSKKLFGVTTRIIEHKTSSVVYCGGKILKTLFNDILKIGNLSENKRVPEIAYSWDNDMLISLVNGYFLGDGYIRISDKTKKAVMATASKDLVLGIRYILYRLGIFTRVDKRDRRFANTWEISIERGRPLQKFAGEILKLHTEGGRASGTELYPSFLFNSGDYTGVQKKMVYSSTTRNGKLGINFALYSTNKMLQTLVAGDVHPVKIIDISTVKYTKPFYDIEVEGNKNFMHGDFIFTHNCDGLNVPIYAVHQKFGSIRTNVAYTSEQELREFVIKLAERSDRYISYAEPLLDGTLRDGSRVQASLAGDVTTRGPTFSIRKFKETPFTPVDMIRLNTVSDDLLAYLWFVVENGSNILITGGVSTGKTSILNTISLFIPSESKIVSIEDSVTGDAEIMVKRNGRIETMKIGSLIDRMIEKYGKEKTGNAEGIEVLTMNKDCKIEFQKPSAFIRHLVNKDIYEVTTSTGKKVKVTKDHSLFGLDDYGNVVAVKPEELEKIRFIATPRYIPVEGTEIKEMNLIEHLDKLKGEFLTGGPISKIFSIPYEEFKTLGISKNKYAWWKRKGIVSTDAFLRLSSSVAFTKDELNQIKIIGKTSSVPIPVVFPISDDFLNLLGLWIGDGSYDNRNKNKVIISNIDKECIETTHRFASSMNIKISLMHDNVSMSLNSTLLYKIMKNVIGLDGYADTKRIPAFIQNMSNRQVAEFLRGYFSADGSVKNYEISCSSQSLGLLNDIQTLLLRFGIISRISHYARKDRCRELSISSSENASKFRQIGFLQERKTLKMNMVASRHAHHTKTDVIPLGRNLAEEISRYEKLSFPYMTGMQNIGRQFLQGISEDCDSELIHRLAESDIFWDEVRDVRKAPAEPLYVYDLSVPENESFVCSNIVLHNTRELNLPHENWIPGVTRIGFAGSGLGEITMFELLRESFRQNPDYLVVGEVRGKEIYVMFQGMASIPGDEKVLVVNSNNLKRIPIGELNVMPDYKIPVFDFESKKIKLLSGFTKVEHTPRKELYRITTKTGRSIVATADHSLFSWNNEIITLPTKELRRGDIIVIPGILPSSYNDIESIDLTELDGIRIFSPDLIKTAVEKLGYEKSSALCGVKSISDYYAKFKRAKPSALDANKFKKLMTKAKIGYKQCDVTVRFDRKSESMPGTLPVTPEFLRFLGYFISEGSLNIGKRSSRISLYSKNKEILEDMRRCIAAISGKVPKERTTSGFGTATELSFSHKVLYEFLRQHIGQKSLSKKVPDFIFGLSKEKIGHFLSGLYSGDGTITKDHFGYFTISKQLASDVSNLLLVFGIVSRIRTRQRSGRKTTDYEILFYSNDEKKEFLKYTQPIRKIPKFGKSNKNRNKIGDIYLDKVKSVEKLMLEKEVPVYDLCVQGHQNFIGGFGGILLHNSGHPSISTMHAGGVDDVLKRLQTKPINLSPGLLDSLDIVLVMVHAREKGKSARRVKEVAEIESVDPSTGTPRINRPFVWLPSTDSFDYKGNSWMLNKISMAKGIPLNKIIKDISQRKKLLNWMYMKNITDIKEIVKYINLYRRNPDKIDQLISGTISESEL